MKALFLSSAVLVFGATAGLAEPFELTDRQMDGVAAGALVDLDIRNNDVLVAVPVNAAVAGVCVVVNRCTANSTATQRGRIR